MNDVQRHVMQYMREWLSDSGDLNLKEAWGSLETEVLNSLSDETDTERLTEIAAAKATRCDELFEELERVAPDSPLLEKIRNEQ